MRQLLLSELLLNPSVQAKDEKRLSRQALDIFKLFCPNGDGRYVAVWTSQLRAVAAQYMARVTELRAWLAGFGLTIDRVQRSEGGNNKYVVRELRGSNYEQRLKRKGLL